jgi:hypothetical protein
MLGAGIKPNRRRQIKGNCAGDIVALQQLYSLRRCRHQRHGDVAKRNGVALVSKPTTNENDVTAKHHSTPELFKKLLLPDNCRDVTSERTGMKLALVGPPMRRIEPT